MLVGCTLQSAMSNGVHEWVEQQAATRSVNVITAQSSRDRLMIILYEACVKVCEARGQNGGLILQEKQQCMYSLHDCKPVRDAAIFS